MLDLICIGNTCIDLFVPPHEPPPRGGISIIPSLSVVPGGNSSNTAICAARLGARAAVAGVLGDDLFGRYLAEFLEKESVDSSLLTLLPDESSPVTMVLNDPQGERSFVHAPGTNSGFSPPRKAIQTAARIFHLAAPELLGTFWPEGCRSLLGTLRELGRKVSLDTFVAPGPSVREDHRPILELVDIAMPNEEEARLITGQKDVKDMVRYLLDCGVKVAVVKRGERGAVLGTEREYREIPTRSTRVVDTCGAGDNFAGGFLAAHLLDLPLEKCVQVGCDMGTRCVGHEGSLTGTSDPEFLSSLRSRLETGA